MARLEAREIAKRYKGRRVVDAASVHVDSGEVVGLLGPNGAGKSTALRLVLGFLKPTVGTARVAGFDCWNQSVEVRKRVAYLPGELRLYESMTGRQLIRFLSELRGEPHSPDIDRLAKQFDINIDTPMTRMSSGMKRKVALLAVLVPRVPLVILDEPTNTLDPTMRDLLLDEIRMAKASGKAVLFSSHVLNEVEAVCDRVVILRKGRLVHEQLMNELRDGRQVTAKLLGELVGSPPKGSVLKADSHLELQYRGELPPLLEWLGRQPLAELQIEPLGLGPIYQQHHGLES